MQASAWFHIAEGILPAYLRLLELPPLRSLPIGAFGRQIVHGTSAGKRSPEEMRRELRRQLAGLNAGPYHKAVRENQQHIRRVSALLAELLPNHRGLRHRRGFRSGDRIDLRIAAQSEADRRLFDKLWIRRNRRTLPDPAFVLVMDRSGSMKGPTRSGAAFASLVVVREACTRNGIPFAVIAFNNCATLLHPWDHQDDERAQAALGLVQNAEGGTDLADALELAGKVIAPRPEKDRFVLVMTDGEIFPAEAKRVHRIKQDLENTGVHFAAIGVDIEAETFHQFFPGAPLLRDCAQLPSVLGDLLVRVQLGL
jgi:hypothetical protein